ncbi:MAG: tetratricopeptide repeat protein [Bacteroidota bacterium]
MRDRAQLDSLHSILLGADTLPDSVKIELAMRTIQYTVNYSLAYPTDSITPSYMFRRAQLFGAALNDPERAATLFDEFNLKYPDYKMAPMSLLLASSAWEEAGNMAKAHNSLNNFIKLYPKHPWIPQAEGMIKQLDMKEAQNRQSEDIVKEGRETKKKS